MSRVVIDGRAVLPHLDGIGRYTIGLVEALSARGDDAWDLTILVRPDANPGAAARLGRAARLHAAAHHHLSPWTLTSLGGLVERLGASVYHSPFMGCPLGGSFRRVVTLHDAIWYRHPWLQEHRSTGRTLVGMLYHRLVFDVAARRADGLVAVSQAALDQWGLGGRATRVIIAPNGVDPVFLRPVPAETRAAVRARHGLGDDPFFLHPTNGKPYKNSERSVRAFLRAGLPVECRLVLVGRPTSHGDAIMAGFEGDGRVIHAGSVPDEELVALMAEARGLLFPSLMEGFGLPVAEAMAVGCPVVASRIPALVEVAGDGALLVDPTDVPAIARALERVHADEELRQRLVTAGRLRAGALTWAVVAERVIRVWETVRASG